jgi:hypothetical protein
METETSGFTFGGMGTTRDAANTMAAIIAPCMNSDTACALPLRLDRSNLNKWIGAPFADDAPNAARAKSCQKFSRTR